MSFAGQVDCQRRLIGPVWPLEIIGNASAEAPAAPAMNLRRDVFAVACATTGFSSFMGFLLGGSCTGVWKRFWAGGSCPSSLGGIVFRAKGKGNTFTRAAVWAAPQRRY